MLREPAKDQRQVFERSGLLLNTKVEHLLQTYTHSGLRVDAASRRVRVCCACGSGVSFAPDADSPFLDFVSLVVVNCLVRTSLRFLRTTVAALTSKIIVRAPLMPFSSFSGRRLWGGGRLWRSISYSPSLSCPVMMLSFFAARALVFPDLGGCLRYEPHGTHDLDLAENASSISASKVCFVILVLKTRGVQVGVLGLALRG
jgi:hypothetical protein